MRLGAGESRRRLLAADHGVLATRHPERGVDAVPVCFAVADDWLAVPLDRVKPKTTTSLRRAANLALNPRAVLLVDQWDPDDWSRLWWVQAHLERVDAPGGVEAALTAALATRYPQYRDEDAIAGLLVFVVRRLAGWAGADSPA